MDTPTERTREFYTWTQFETDCAKIFAWAETRKFQAVYGIPRGGLVLGVKISHLLNVPLILNKDDITRHTLVVDDIADTGETLERLKQTIGDRCSIATLFKGMQSRIVPDFYVREKASWIVFPWETDASSRYDHAV